MKNNHHSSPRRRDWLFAITFVLSVLVLSGYLDRDIQAEPASHTPHDTYVGDVDTTVVEHTS